MLLVHGMDGGRSHYKERHYGKHNILLLNMCLLYIYLPPYMIGKYLGTYHNNITHISSAVAHDV